MNTITISIALALCAVVIFLLIAQQRGLIAQLKSLRGQLEEKTKSESALQIEAATLRERLSNMETAHRQREEESEQRFKALAANILDENSRRLREQASASLSELLNPLHSRIEEFKKTIADTYSAEARERFSLEKSLKDLVELNQSIGREAKELSEALRGNSKTQGDWGEMILEHLLERSGLEKNVHFKVQMGTNTDGSPLTDSEGHRLRPDVVMLYPDQRCVVVDSKVSLTAYVDFVNAEDDDTRNAAGKRHLESVRAHIKELNAKAYQDIVGDKRLDFVVMFIPNEAAYIAAMQLDSTIWHEAYDKRVLIASPTHLVSILRMLEQLWKQEAVNRNVERIARESGAMLDKFDRFVKEMENIEKSLSKATAAYQNAFSLLSTGKGNLMRRAKNLMELGAKTKSASILSLHSEDDASDNTEEEE